MAFQSTFSFLFTFQSWYHSQPIFCLYLFLLAVALTYLTWTIIYNLFFHPLRRFPGPKAAACSYLPTIYAMLTGQIHIWQTKLHTQYGSVVRTGPNTLSYTHTAGWKEIYGLRKDAKLAKDPEFYIAQPNGVFSILSANDQNHARFRRVFSHAFSDKALKEQQPLFMQYLNLLVQKLNKKIETQPEEGINMVSMLNFTTFDIMADLTFGAPLGMLASSEYHPWVATIFATLKLGAIIRALSYLPLFKTMVKYLLPKSLAEKRRAHFEFSSEQVNVRLSRELDRPDIWNLVLKKKEQEGGLSLDEMHANAALFMAAGTETTATELSGTLYYLMKNPDKMALLVEEIRTEFPNDEDISMEKLPQIKYLHACLEEGLRIYPPVPVGLPRVSPKEGATVLGEFIPPNTRVSLSQYSAYHSPLNFAHPDTFHPERWLPPTSPLYNPVFATDQKAALQPFSVGSRNCLGKNLAYHEMKLVLAKLLWNFDFELCKESEGWAEKQKVFVLWEKRPLMVRLRKRN